jgi:hypothetical protein
MTTPQLRPKKAAMVAGLLLAVALHFFSCGKESKTYNLIYISLDTTRYDFVNTGRGARANTPELKRFASQAVVMDNAYATIPQTLPSHLSNFTSRFPHELGVLANENEYDGRFRMIQEVLKDRDYYTAGVISLGSVSGKTGISRGFDEYNEDLLCGWPGDQPGRPESAQKGRGKTVLPVCPLLGSPQPLLPPGQEIRFRYPAGRGTRGQLQRLPGHDTPFENPAEKRMA